MSKTRKILMISFTVFKAAVVAFFAASCFKTGYCISGVILSGVACLCFEEFMLRMRGSRKDPDPHPADELLMGTYRLPSKEEMRERLTYLPNMSYQLQLRFAPAVLKEMTKGAGREYGLEDIVMMIGNGIYDYVRKEGDLKSIKEWYRTYGEEIIGALMSDDELLAKRAKEIFRKQYGI